MYSVYCTLVFVCRLGAFAAANTLVWLNITAWLWTKTIWTFGLWLSLSQVKMLTCFYYKKNRKQCKGNLHNSFFRSQFEQAHPPAGNQSPLQPETQVSHFLVFFIRIALLSLNKDKSVSEVGTKFSFFTCYFRIPFQNNDEGKVEWWGGTRGIVNTPPPTFPYPQIEQIHDFFLSRYSRCAK